MFLQELPSSLHKYSDQQLVFVPGTLYVLCTRSSPNCKHCHYCMAERHHKSFAKKNTELRVLILGWKNTGQGDHSTCKCGTWAIFLSSQPFFLVVSHEVNSMQKLTSWLLGLKPKLCTILHMKHMNKILLTPTRCCRSVLLTQAQREQLRHPLERNSCLGNILPLSHHEEGRQTGEVQGNRVRLTLKSSFFPSLPALSAIRPRKSAGRWRISSLAYSSNPALAACQTHLSSLLAGGEQISRNKVTAVCTACTQYVCGT